MHRLVLCALLVGCVGDVGGTSGDDMPGGGGGGGGGGDGSGGGGGGTAPAPTRLVAVPDAGHDLGVRADATFAAMAVTELLALLGGAAAAERAHGRLR